MEQITALQAPQLLALFETDKAQRAEYAAQIIEGVKEGRVNPLAVQLQFSCTTDLIKSVNTNPDYKAALLEEAARNGKTFEFHKATFQTKEGGTKYDYSVCNDPTLNDLLAQQAALDEQVKARQKLLQNVPEKGQIMTDDDTGETTTVYRPAKTSTTTIAVTLK